MYFSGQQYKNSVVGYLLLLCIVLYSTSCRTSHISNLAGKHFVNKNKETGKIIESYLFIDSINVKYSDYTTLGDKKVLLGKYNIDKNKIEIEKCDTSFFYLTKQSPYVKIERESLGDSTVNIRMKVWILDSVNYVLCPLTDLFILDDEKNIVEQIQIKDSVIFSLPCSHNKLFLRPIFMNRDIMDIGITPLRNTEIDLYFDFNWLVDRDPEIIEKTYKYNKGKIKDKKIFFFEDNSFKDSE
jgi:hypothetical protein